VGLAVEGHPEATAPERALRHGLPGVRSQLCAAARREPGAGRLAVAGEARERSVVPGAVHLAVTAPWPWLAGAQGGRGRVTAVKMEALELDGCLV
jgi:hypothetical protein